MKRNEPIVFPCERWMDYVSLPIDTPLPPEFAEHLTTCSVCQNEWSQLRIVWEALALDVDEDEVPAGWKEEVMNAIFGDPPALPTEQPLRESRSPRRIAFPIVAAAAACLLLAVSGIGVWHWMKPYPSKLIAGAATSNLQREWSLTSIDKSMPKAKGQVKLVRQGGDQIMVVSTEGLKPTSGGQAYQVWLIREGQRDNCGTFRVDQSGNGMLVYRMDEAEEGIQGIGITLEPDSDGLQPRGQKVLGTATSAPNS